MDKANSKILTVSYATAAGLLGLTVHLLLKILANAFGFFAQVSGSDAVRHGLPVVVGLVTFAVLQFNPKVNVWAEEVVSEVRKVVWPSRKDTTAMTIVVVIMVLISSVIVSSFDMISGFLINQIVK